MGREDTALFSEQVELNVLKLSANPSRDPLDVDAQLQPRQTPSVAAMPGSSRDVGMAGSYCCDFCGARYHTFDEALHHEEHECKANPNGAGAGQVPVGVASV